MQTRLESLIETFINIAIGYVVAICSQMLIFPYFGIDIPLSTNLALGGFFTVISIIRSYLVRRYFNSRIKHLAHKFG
jgi:hypothetical protein